MYVLYIQGEICRYAEDTIDSLSTIFIRFQYYSFLYSSFLQLGLWIDYVLSLDQNQNNSA